MTCRKRLPLFFSILLAAYAHAISVSYRSPDDGRAWSVMLDAAEPLVWQWADGAVSATLISSNLVSAATASTVVARGASLDGSALIPGAASAGEDERLFDVTLTQTDGSATVAEKTVRLKIGAPSVVYVDADDKDFQSISEPRLYSWSSLWSDDTSAASAATLATSVKNGAAIGNWTLPATGGFGTMSTKETFGGKRGPVVAELSFDGVTSLVADLIAKGLGISIILR